MKIEPSVKEPVVLPALAQKLLRQKKKKSYHGLYDYVQINLTYLDTSLEFSPLRETKNGKNRPETLQLLQRFRKSRRRR